MFWVIVVVIVIFYLTLLVGGIVGILSEEDPLNWVIAWVATFTWLAMGGVIVNAVFNGT